MGAEGLRSVTVPNKRQYIFARNRTAQRERMSLNYPQNFLRRVMDDGRENGKIKEKQTTEKY